jgi:hypothetical protein
MRRRPKPIKVKIRRALWTIIFEKPPHSKGLQGRCFHNQRTIYVKLDADTRGSLLHEIAHAAIPYATEEEVCDLERATMAVLNQIP